MLSFLFSTLSLIVACVSACSCFMMHHVYLDTWVEFGVYNSSSVIRCVSWLRSITGVHVCVCALYCTSVAETKAGRPADSDSGDLPAACCRMTLLSLWNLLTFLPRLRSFDWLAWPRGENLFACLALFIWSNPSSVIITITGHRTHCLYGNFDFYSLYLVTTNESKAGALPPARLLYNNGWLWAKRRYLGV